jgi:transcription termination/antitermination protein NusG
LLGLPAVGDNAAMEAEPHPNRFKVGDRVRINEGVFKNFVGVVDTVDEGNGRVSVLMQVYGRTAPVEVEPRQIDPA